MKTKTVFVNSVSVRVGRLGLQLRVKLVTVFRLVQVFILRCRIQERGMWKTRTVWTRNKGHTETTQRGSWENMCSVYWK